MVWLVKQSGGEEAEHSGKKEKDRHAQQQQCSPEPEQELNATWYKQPPTQVIPWIEHDGVSEFNDRPVLVKSGSELS